MNIEGECIFSNYYFCFFWIFTQDWNNCWVIRYLGGFPGGTSGKDPTCQCKRFKRCRFSPWVGETPLKENMATHSSILAWRLPWTEEPCRLQPRVLQRVEHDWSNLVGMHAHGIFYLLFFFFFLRNHHTVFHSGCINLHSYKCGTRVPFSHIFPEFYYLYSFWWQPFWQASSDISLWFWFEFSWWLVMLSIFSCACWSPAYSLWKKKCLFSSSVHF